MADVLVNFRQRDQAHQCPSSAGERLLYAGLRSRIDLPYECASGTCGTCKAKLVSGEVDDLWSEAPGRKYLSGPNEILLCQCAPRGDCTIEVPVRKLDPVPDAAPTFGRGIVRSPRLLAPDVMQFSVDVGRPIDYQAGQFVCLQFPHAAGYRSYSVVNFERGCDRLDFVVKRKADGKLTPWLFENDIEGCELEWFGPLGRAIFEPGRPHDIVCIAGGTGIAGIMSILRCAAQAGHFAHSKANVFFGVRTQVDTFYLAELHELVKAANGALKVTIALSGGEPQEGAQRAYALLQFRRGFVHEVAKSEMAGKYQGVVAYLAGPKAAVDAAMRVLLAARVPVQNMRFDKFS